MSDRNEEIRKQEQEWKDGPVAKALERFPLLSECPSRFYTPADKPDDFDFLEKVGFPGQYPFTAGAYPFDPMSGMSRFAAMAPAGAASTRAALYSGYGRPEDTRDYYKNLIEKGGKEGPNLAMDLPVAYCDRNRWGDPVVHRDVWPRLTGA